MQTKTVAGRTWHFSHPIGWLSGRGRGFVHPSSVVITSEGVIYVLNNRGKLAPPVTVLTIDEEYLGEFGEGDFTWPNGLASDQDGNIYCADGFEHFVNVYSSEGDHLAKWGEHGADEGLLNRPAGLAFDSDDNLWVVDSENGRVQQFTRDGQFLSAIGTQGSEEGQLSRPWGLAIDQNDDVLRRRLGQRPRAEVLSGRRVPGQVRLHVRRWGITEQAVGRCGRQRRGRVRHRLGQRPRPRSTIRMGR